MLSMHAARMDLETLPSPKGDRAVVTGDGDFAAQNKRFGVEVVAMIGRNQVRLHATVHNAVAGAPKVCFEFNAIH